MTESTSPFGVEEQAIWDLENLPIDEARARILELDKQGIQVHTRSTASLYYPEVEAGPGFVVTGYTFDLSPQLAHLGDEERSEWFGKINDLALRAGSA